MLGLMVSFLTSIVVGKINIIWTNTYLCTTSMYIWSIDVHYPIFKWSMRPSIKFIGVEWPWLLTKLRMQDDWKGWFSEKHRKALPWLRALLFALGHDAMRKNNRVAKVVVQECISTESNCSIMIQDTPNSTYIYIYVILYLCCSMTC